VLSLHVVSLGNLDVRGDSQMKMIAMFFMVSEKNQGRRRIFAPGADQMNQRLLAIRAW
jgi:hypothetical protein